MQYIGLLILLVLSPLASSYEIQYLADTNNSTLHYEPQTIERVYARDLSSKIFSAVSLRQYKDFIIKLTENGSREVDSEANGYARTWIANQLVELSDNRISVEILGNYGSVVGRLPGYISDSAPCFVIGGHYDTVAGAPGANDDGTGVATVLELARVMSAYEWPLDIYFCAFNAEEIGLYGSAEVADIFSTRNLDILLYYNIDMLLVEDPHAPPDERVLMAYDLAEYWALLTRAMSNNYGLNLIHPIPSNAFSAWGASDHVSFIQAGYGQVLFAFESGFSYDTAYHRPTDTYDNELYNYTVAIETVKAIGASMAFEMAREYGVPKRLCFKSTIASGNHLQYFFPITIKTDFTIIGNWSSGVNFSLIAPSGVQAVSASFQNATFSLKPILNHTTSEVGLYKLKVEPLLTSSSDDDDITSFHLSYDSSSYEIYYFEVSYDTDVNNDLILDSKQFWFDAELFDVDADLDGLSDGYEKIIGTSPTEPDTDMDGLSDGWELENGTNPFLQDADEDNDADGLTNEMEYSSGTLPNDNDTDNDLMPDGFEVVHGLNPLENDSLADLDSDNLTNIYEYILGTNPSSNDSDEDEIPDDWEVLHNLDPLIDDASLDPDEDTILNIDEYKLGLDPHNPDSRLDPTLLLIIPITALGIAILILILRRRMT